MNKPSFNPPNWVFGPVWTALYILMAVAAWRIYLGPESRSRRAALGHYGVQLALKLGWSIVFFEHSVAVTADGYEIFTLSPKGYHHPPYPV